MGAKMVEFNGWDMPVEYPSAGGIIVRAQWRFALAWAFSMSRTWATYALQGPRGFGCGAAHLDE
jgi:glycine cleavage system aminomethyltransferase T